MYVCCVRGRQVGLHGAAVDARWSVRLISTSSPLDPPGQRDGALQQHEEAGRPARPRRRPSRPAGDRARPGRARAASPAGRRSSDSKRNSSRISSGVRAVLVTVSLMLIVLQVPVHQRDGHRALADRGRDPLDRLGAHVAGHEHAGHARLQVVRLAVERPAGRAALAVDEQVRAGQHEAVARPVDARRPSHSVRGCRADEDEQVADVAPLPRRRSGRRAAVSRSRCSSPCGLDHLGAGAHVDVSGSPRSARSGSATSSARGLAADQQRDRARRAGRRTSAAWPAEFAPPTM